LSKSTKDVYVSNWDKFSILRQIYATILIKFLYAFCFQEIIIPMKCTKLRPIFILGGMMGPAVCWIADIVSWNYSYDYWYKDQYPGKANAKYNSPHAVWHEVAADALGELVMLYD